MDNFTFPPPPPAPPRATDEQPNAHTASAYQSQRGHGGRNGPRGRGRGGFRGGQRGSYPRSSARGGFNHSFNPQNNHPAHVSNRSRHRPRLHRPYPRIIPSVEEYEEVYDDMQDEEHRGSDADSPWPENTENSGTPQHLQGLPLDFQFPQDNATQGLASQWSPSVSPRSLVPPHFAHGFEPQHPQFDPHGAHPQFAQGFAPQQAQFDPHRGAHPQFPQGMAPQQAQFDPHRGAHPQFPQGMAPQQAQFDPHRGAHPQFSQGFAPQQAPFEAQGVHPDLAQGFTPPQAFAPHGAHPQFPQGFAPQQMHFPPHDANLPIPRPSPIGQPYFIVRYEDIVTPHGFLPRRIEYLQSDGWPHAAQGFAPGLIGIGAGIVDVPRGHVAAALGPGPMNFIPNNGMPDFPQNVDPAFHPAQHELHVRDPYQAPYLHNADQQHFGMQQPPANAPYPHPNFQERIPWHQTPTLPSQPMHGPGAHQFGNHQTLPGNGAALHNRGNNTTAPRRPSPQVAPAVPRFGGPLPTTIARHAFIPETAGHVLADLQGIGKKRKINQLGLTPKGAEYEESDEDVDEEMALGATTGPLTVEYKGKTSVLGTEADLQAWIEERKKRWPTNARVDQKAEDLAKRQAEQAAVRQKVIESQVRNQTAKKQLPNQESKPLNDDDAGSTTSTSSSSSASGDSEAESEIDSDHDNHDPSVGDAVMSDVVNDIDSGSESAPDEQTSKSNGPIRVLPPPREKSNRTCKYFLRYGRCTRGDQCFFRHEKLDPMVKESGNKRERKPVKLERKTLYQRMVEQELATEQQATVPIMSRFGRGASYDEQKDDTVAEQKDQRVDEQKDDTVAEQKDQRVGEQNDDTVAEQKDQRVDKQKDEDIDMDVDQQNEECVGEEEDEGVDEQKDDTVAEQKDQRVDEQKDDTVAEQKDQRVDEQKDEDVDMEVDQQNEECVGEEEAEGVDEQNPI